MAYNYVVLFLINFRATDASIETMTILLILKKAGLLLNLARNIYLLIFQSNNNFTSCKQFKKVLRGHEQQLLHVHRMEAYLNENIIVHFWKTNGVLILPMKSIDNIDNL